MATSDFGSDSSDYGFDLTAEEEQQLLALVDRVSRSSLPPSAAAPTLAPPPTSPPPLAPIYIRAPPPLISAQESFHDLSEDDLDFDISELDPQLAPSPSTKPTRAKSPPEFPRNVASPNKRRFSPSAAWDHYPGVPSFVSKVKAHHAPTAIMSADVRYPDIRGVLSGIDNTTDTSKDEDQLQPPRSPFNNQKQSPLLRFRTFPKKPFSVSDLTAGSWCELQYYYTLTRLPGGRRTRTAAMKSGTDVHKKLEVEVYTPVEVEIAKKEDAFGLKIWNIIQGLRTLRDTGLTRELEVWGLVDGNVVNGVIDGLSYKNPDPELEEDVISSRGGSQSSPRSSQQQQKLISAFFPSGTPADKFVYITDVKTRARTTPPSKAQVRGTIIQLFLYHRFLSDMASDKLDYIRTFERYGLNPDETFSDTFMAQIASLHDEIFGTDDDGDSSGTSWQSEASDSAATTDFLSAVSSPSKLTALGGDDDTRASSGAMKYSSLRALIPLLKFEIQLTFPKGASSVGQIVAVEYRYRSRTKAEQQQEGNEITPGSIICTNTHFVEPEILDLYLKDDMQWWRGEREPRGVALEDAFKCGICEFARVCEWRENLDQEALRKAKATKETSSRQKGATPAW